VLVLLVQVIDVCSLLKFIFCLFTLVISYPVLLKCFYSEYVVTISADIQYSLCLVSVSFAASNLHYKYILFESYILMTNYESLQCLVSRFFVQVASIQ